VQRIGKIVAPVVALFVPYRCKSGWLTLSILFLLRVGLTKALHLIP